MVHVISCTKVLTQRVRQSSAEKTLSQLQKSEIIDKHCGCVLLATSLTFHRQVLRPLWPPSCFSGFTSCSLMEFDVLSQKKNTKTHSLRFGLSIQTHPLKDFPLSLPLETSDPELQNREGELYDLMIF